MTEPTQRRVSPVFDATPRIPPVGLTGGSTLPLTDIDIEARRFRIALESARQFPKGSLGLSVEFEGRRSHGRSFTYAPDRQNGSLGELSVPAEFFNNLEVGTSLRISRNGETFVFRRGIQPFFR